MSGTLYVTGTPIGNLSDFSPRAVETLKAVDFIAAEDTRVTVKLLNHFDIKRPMVSYHEHNLRERGEAIIERILNGENCAVVSDAGMPCVSDPGEDLVRLAAEKGVPTVVIPGPSAAVSALCISGLSTSRFSFEGFLSTNKRNRQLHLESLKNDTHTLIFYEAPHKLLTTLRDMERVLGDRRISIGRELTKIHEEVIRTTLREAIAFYEEKTPKGEFVLVLEGATPETEPQISLEGAIEEAKQLVAEGERLTEAAKKISAQYGYKKSEIYNGLI
ncbi:16S rRNA (cytidine(1402)-2'-O)-methyltransferase [Fumia xinanensis]|uniref:Ribosomal RNA small subunit methyltransferase I n=1 Tax=Fumia xinanensis TaxID=2763659 RepID=A0A926E5A8_9FIRM|nr:16S rRNA (cytidine(1402)-2'-O)-methyltransferase [Fumia xinanensis]MBC8560409.1 16S rRNA (cytidine(1402)-2'-O)-methyltransferase [Fumia xinanensis]PWL46401.1 MAG: 16S rRNA (cytidine(1402)-2'-O)-methyltransferase [Clostridiales bacterium]